MSLRERTNDDRERPGTDPGNPGGGNLDRLRLQGQGFLTAGADAIERALSGDSERFLAATRQQGGE